MPGPYAEPFSAQFSDWRTATVISRLTGFISKLRCAGGVLAARDSVHVRAAGAEVVSVV